ncbi:MAG: class I SAM-dependent methyltransferase [Coriobacteriia bacterium]|nr:class I SAM-dependent methyltransferase [Coriobacteriia bacterium]
MGDREERVRAQYETWLGGRTPVALYVRWYLRHGGARDAPQLFGAMGGGPFGRVLDVGCATGFYLRWAFDHGHGHRVLAGVDLSTVMLSEAAARLCPAREAGVDVRLHQASATALPFPDGSFDALICNGVAKYLDDDMFSAFLVEAARVLTSGGKVAVADFGRPVALQSVIMPPGRFGIPVDYLRPSDTLCEALADHGFEGVTPVGLKRVRRIPLTYEGAVAARS